MPEHFADRLMAAVATRGAPCTVALDPLYEHLPPALQSGKGGDDGTRLADIEQFCMQLLDVIAPIVPSVKVNSAYFERYHAAGIALYDRLIQQASRLGLVVIGDVKRGDVGHTAQMYAQAHLRGDHGNSQNIADAVTVSGYFGIDGVQPFLDECRVYGRGIFVLVRTSNPSAAAMQDLRTSDGRRVCEVIADQVAMWSEQEGAVGRCGYSYVGAVTATRDPAAAARLRALMPKSILLVPGYGAQGGSAADFLPYFNRDRSGAIVAAGRSIIFAHQDAARATIAGGDWRRCVEHAARDFVSDVARLLQS